MLKPRLPPLFTRTVHHLVSAVLVVWLTTTAAFFALRLTGDPLTAILGGPGSQASPEAVAAAIAQYHLDLPLWQQYVTQLWQVFTLQFGDSYARKQPVSELLQAGAAPTLIIATLALVLAWILTVAVCFALSVSRGIAQRVLTPLFSGFATLASVTPQALLGALLILGFALQLDALPATSAGSSPVELVLPVCTLAVPVAGYLIHILRSALDEYTQAPFVLSAAARGASASRIFFRHTLRHAALPAVALSAWAYGSLISGAVVVESLFARPGLGRLLTEAALARDLPVVLGCVTVIAVCYVLVMAVAAAIERWLIHGEDR